MVFFHHKMVHNHLFRVHYLHQAMIEVVCNIDGTGRHGCIAFLGSKASHPRECRE